MAESPQDINNEFENHSIQDIIGKYLPYWPLFLFLIAIGGVIAYFKLRYATPIFQANSSIMIKTDNQGGQDVILQQLNISNSGKNLQNEIEILKSRPISKQIVRNLNLYAPITEEGSVRKMSGYVSSPVVFIMQNPDSFKPAGQVYFTCNHNNTVTFNNQAYPINEFVSTPYGMMMIKPNKYFQSRNEAHPFYFSLVPVADMAGGVQGGISITSDNKESTVVNLHFADESPQRAEDILNELVNVYNNAAVYDKNQLATNTLRFVEERLRFVKSDLDTVERQLEQYKSSNRIVDVSAQGSQYLQRVGENDGRITQIDMQLSQLNEAQKYVNSKESNKDAIVPSIIGIADPTLSGLLQRLYDAESRQATMRKTVGENYPALTAVTEQINTLRPEILENMRTQRQGLLASRGNLESANGRYNSMLGSIPSQERQLINISRQQAIKNTIYSFLLQKREETALSLASTSPDSRLVNDAQTGGIISPNPRNVYLQWIISAIILGAIFVFVRENLNRNVLSRQEIEKITAAPVIAEITFNRTGEAIVVNKTSRTIIAEQFRYLRTALNYIGINTRKKTFLLTSSISGEGKSFITCNLGATLALANKKVVVLEMDLRKPKLAEMMEVERRTGLSDFLVGSKSVSEIIKPTSVENLSIITSGVTPPNPAELLLSARLPELLTALEASYDYILIDTAPVSPVTDAYIISPLCDATLYVVRQGKTPRVLIQKLNDVLRSQRLKNISIIFNGVKEKKFGGYYGYGKTYGYGYLEEDKKKKKK